MLGDQEHEAGSLSITTEDELLKHPSEYQSTPDVNKAVRIIGSTMSIVSIPSELAL